MRTIVFILLMLLILVIGIPLQAVRVVFLGNMEISKFVVIKTEDLLHTIGLRFIYPLFRKAKKLGK